MPSLKPWLCLAVDNEWLQYASGQNVIPHSIYTLQSGLADNFYFFLSYLNKTMYNDLTRRCLTFTFQMAYCSCIFTLQLHT